MQRLGFYFFRAIIGLFYLIPFPVLYLLSDGLAFFFHRILRYRYSIIANNLRRSLPHKSEADIEAIIRDFYRNFTDISLETIKGLSLSAKTLQERYHFEGIPLLNNYLDDGKSVLLMGPHMANWEWGVLSVPLWMRHPIVGVYKPLSNPFIDNFYNKKRKAFGLLLSSMNQAGRSVVQHRKTPTAFVFIADQSPSDVRNAHWLTFLHQETPFLQGVDKLAHKTNYPVFFFDIIRRKRGHYSVRFSLLHDEPASTPVGQITRLYAQRLQTAIEEEPYTWLWSHRRWKRKKPEENVISL